jgi:hypothetical protein
VEAADDYSDDDDITVVRNKTLKEMSFSERAKAISLRKKKNNKFSLATLVHNAKRKTSENVKKFEEITKDYSIPTNAPTYSACKESYSSGGIARALSKAHDTIRLRAWNIVREKRDKAHEKASRASRNNLKRTTARYMVRFNKLPPQDWLKIPEWLIIRDEDCFNFDNIKKGGIYHLPALITGTKKGIWDMLISYTDKEPGTEEYGSIIKSKYGVDVRNNSSNNYCEYKPCYEALVSMVEFYRVAFKFCKKDPYAAIYRANMRTIHPVWNIRCDGMYFANDFAVARGNHNVHTGIEVNGVFYRVPAAQIVDTFMRFKDKEKFENLYLMLVRIQAFSNISVDASAQIWGQVRANMSARGLSSVQQYLYPALLNKDPIKDDDFHKVTANFGNLFNKLNRVHFPEVVKHPSIGSSSGIGLMTENPTVSEQEDEGGTETGSEFSVSKMMSGLDSDIEIIPSDAEASDEEEEYYSNQNKNGLMSFLDEGVDSFFKNVRSVTDNLTETNNITGLFQVTDDLHSTEPNYAATAPNALLVETPTGYNLPDEREFTRRIQFEGDRIVFIKHITQKLIR